MNIDELKAQLTNSITEGLTNKFDKVNEALGNDGLYAYTLYCASGFYAPCIATSTKKSLIRIISSLQEAENNLLESLKEQHSNLLDKFSPSSDLYAEMTACEWEYIYNDIPEFENLDSVISEIYEYSYEEADEDFDVCKFLTSAILEGILKFKNSATCDNSLLLGLQFSDPSEQETSIVADISHQVNQAHWHNKLLSLYNEQSNS